MGETAEPSPAEDDALVDTASAKWPHSGRERWLWVERIPDGADGGWATGHFVRPYKIIIETGDVEQFAIDLALIPIDWNRRVVLRINGDASELTRKHYPTIHLRRTPAGSWEPVDVDGVGK